MTRLKIGILSVLLLSAAAALLVGREHLRARIRAQDEALLQQAARIALLEAENERLSNSVVQAGHNLPPASDPSRELLRLRGEVGVLRQETNELGNLRKENLALSQAVADSGTNQLPAEDQLLIRQTHAVDAITTLLQAIRNYATNHAGQYPVNLGQLIASGDLGATNLPGNLGSNDFEFGPAAGLDPQGNQAILRLRVPIPKPGGGTVMVVGGLSQAGVPHTATWNVGP